MRVAKDGPPSDGRSLCPCPFLDAAAAMMFSTSYRYRPPSRSISRAWVSSTMPGRPRLVHRAWCCRITPSDLTLASIEAYLTAPGRTLATVQSEGAQTDRQRQLRVYEKTRTAGTGLSSQKTG